MSFAKMSAEEFIRSKFSIQSVDQPSTSEQSYAYGKISFGSSKLGILAKYDRVPSRVSMADILVLMRQYWRLNTDADLILSFIGNAKTLRGAEREQFVRGILKTVTATSAWLITDGVVPSGFANLIGQAISQRRQQVFAVNENMHIIGICDWNQILGAEYLVNTNLMTLHKTNYPAQIRKISAINNEKELEPNHTHFLFIDATSEPDDQVYSATAKFKAALLNHLNSDAEFGGLGIPTLSVLVGGDIDALQQACCVLDANQHLLICEKPAVGAAFLLSYALRQYRNLNSTTKEKMNELEQKIRARIATITKSHLDTKLIDDATNAVMHVLDQQHLVHFFSLGERQLQPLDTEIANVVLVSIKYESSIALEHKLQITMKWRRADLARRLLIGDIDVEENDRQTFMTPTLQALSNHLLHQFMFESLIDGDVDFVKLFMDVGVDAEDFVTVEMLLRLYNEMLSISDHMSRIFRQSMTTSSNDGDNQRIDIDLIEKKLTQIHGVFYHQLYSIEAQNNNDVMMAANKTPVYELLVWSIIANRPLPLILFLWEQSELPLQAACLGMQIAKRLEKKFDGYDRVVEAQYKEIHMVLEERAIGIVNTAFELDPIECKKLLHIKMPRYGHATCMQIARMAKSEAFFSTIAVQQVVRAHWTGDFDLNAFEITTGVALFGVPVALRKSKYRYRGTERDRKRNKRNVSNAIALTSHNALQINLGVTDLNHNRTQNVNSMWRTRRSNKVSDLNIEKSLTSNILQNHDQLINTILPYIPQENRFGRFLYRDLCFLSTPIAKFCNHMIWYIIYLLFYSYLLLFSYRPNHLSKTEFAVYMWQSSFLFENARLVLHMPSENMCNNLSACLTSAPSLILKFIRNLKLDSIAVLFSFAAFVFKWRTDTFPIALLLMCFALIPYYMQVFKVHQVNNYLGPKVIMIKRMSWDILMFMSVLIVFVAAYSVSTYTLLNPNNILSGGFYPEIFWDLFNIAAWDIFGEINNQAMLGKAYNCGNFSFESNFSLNCMVRVYSVPILLFGYLIFVNVLLVNMLIAIFTHVFDEIQAKAEEVWKYQMYILLEEFYNKPILPAPWILLDLVIYRGLRYIFCRFLCHNGARERSTANKQRYIGCSFAVEISESEREELLIFQRMCRADYLERRNKESVTQIVKDAKDIHDHLKQMQQELTNLRELVAQQNQQNVVAPTATLNESSEFGSR